VSRRFHEPLYLRTISGATQEYFLRHNPKNQSTKLTTDGYRPENGIDHQNVMLKNTIYIQYK